MNADTQVTAHALGADEVALVVEVFRMLADQTRVRLLWAMLDAEMSVSELATALAKPAPGISQHLAKLRMAHLVRTRPQGNQVFYRIENSHVRQLIQDAVFHADHASIGIPTHHRADPGMTILTEAPFDTGAGAQ